MEDFTLKQLLSFLVIFILLMGAWVFVIDVIEKNKAEQRQEDKKNLIANFEYVQDVTFKVTDKGLYKIEQATGIDLPVYYLVAIKDDRVYELEVTKKMYLRIASGDELTVKEGKDKRYFLSTDEKEVIVKSSKEIEE